MVPIGWAILSYENPARPPAVLDPMAAILEAAPDAVPVVGYWQGAHERGFAIFGLPLDQLISLARDLGQQAVLVPDGVLDVWDLVLYPATGVVAGEEALRREAYTVAPWGAFSCEVNWENPITLGKLREVT